MILILKENIDRKTLFNKTVANATMIYVIDRSKVTERPGKRCCQ